jgi:hypothetical protein
VLTGRLPDVRAISNRGERSLAAGSRGNISMIRTPGDTSRGKECYIQIVIDNIVRYRSSPGAKPFNLDTVDPSTVAAMEFYTVSQRALQYQSSDGSQCGTLLIWLRS